jgi:flagellar motility protein MotE (MotC chaperone)
MGDRIFTKGASQLEASLAKLSSIRDAGKVLARMQPAKAKDIREAIDRVAADPTAPNNNLRALKRAERVSHLGR